MEKKIQNHTSSCFVAQIDPLLAPKLQEDLEGQGFVLSKPDYTFFNAKKAGVSCTFYLSGKLVVQGSQMASFIEFYLEPEILKNFAFTHEVCLLDKTARIGIDESGKGDFFGPLCIAGVFAADDLIVELAKLKVKDSKTLSDKRILELAQKIKEKCVHHVLTIEPKRYNELYSYYKNLNTLLGFGHATVIEALVKKSGCHTVFIDQFAHESVVLQALQKKNLSVILTQRHRGEEDIVVAAASILARSAFIESMDQLSCTLNVTLPKGASAKVIETGRQILATHGEGALQHIAKTHFKTFHQIIL